MGAVIQGVDLATACAGAPKGALYIGPDGFPVGDPNQRIIGDPNPKWTGSLRTALTVKKFQISGLLDFKHGGVINNGTKGALYAYGTHKDTQQRADCTFDAPATRCARAISRPSARAAGTMVRSWVPAPARRFRSA
jgi:hypothetical protein